MKLLFFEPKLCIKTYKYSLALSRMGHSIDMAYVTGKFDLNYKLNDKYVKNFHQVKKSADIVKLMRYGKYDRLICKDISPMLGELVEDPIVLSKLILLIGDIHMIRTTNAARIRLEKGVFKKLNPGRVIFSGTFIKAEVNKLLKNRFEKSAVVPNVPVAIHSGLLYMPKLSDTDNKIHLVYCGSLQNDQGHRNFNQVFASILEYCPNVVLHVVPTKYKEGINGLKMRFNDRMVIHESVINDKLHSFLTQFDIGLCFFDMSHEDKNYIHISEANKFYDYLFAGLPQITNDSRSYRYLVNKYKCGETLSVIDANFESTLVRVKSIQINYDIDKESLDSKLKELSLFAK